MSERYFVDSPVPEDQDRIQLEGHEGHHLARVMRARAGEPVVLFDGSGQEFEAIVESVHRDRVQLSILKRAFIDRERKLPICLGVAMPKGDRQKVLIEKAVEIGISRLLPLETARSQTTYSEKSRERWRRYIIEASKQCRRNRLMEIGEPLGFEELIQSTAWASRWIAHPYGGETEEVDASRLTVRDTAPPVKVLIAIGPEGGFSADEFGAALAAGWRRLDLGPRILRVETAAIVAACRFDPPQPPPA